MEEFYEIPIDMDRRAVAKEVGFVQNMEHYLGATWPAKQSNNPDWVVIDEYTWPKRLLIKDDPLLNVFKL